MPPDFGLMNTMTGVTLVDGIGLIANVLCSLSCEDGKEMLKDTDLFPEEISSLPDLGKRIGQVRERNLLT